MNMYNLKRTDVLMAQLAGLTIGKQGDSAANIFFSSLGVVLSQWCW